MKTFLKLVDKITTLSGSPWAVLASIATVILWLFSTLITGLTNFSQLIINTLTTIITFLLVFMIQNTQNRSDKALHTKLDGIIEKLDTPNQLEGIESLSEKEIDELRSKILSGPPESP